MKADFEQARSGDLRALTSLLMEQKDFICNVVRRFVRDRECAKDVVQNVFVKVIKGIGAFEGSCKFSTWVYRLTINECIEFNRRLRISREYVRDLGDADELVAVNGPDGFSDIADQQIEAEIASALEETPLDSQAAFRLFYYGGYSGKQGAEIMKITEANFFMKVKSARDKVRQRLIASGWR